MSKHAPKLRLRWMYCWYIILMLDSDQFCLIDDLKLKFALPTTFSSIWPMEPFICLMWLDFSEVSKYLTIDRECIRSRLIINMWRFL